MPIPLLVRGSGLGVRERVAILFVYSQVGEPVDARAEHAAGVALHPTGRLHGQDLLEGSRQGGSAHAQQAPSRDAGGRKSIRRRRSSHRLTLSSIPYPSQGWSQENSGYVRTLTAPESSVTRMTMKLVFSTSLLPQLLLLKFNTATI